jgi:hypothetical protein
MHVTSPSFATSGKHMHEEVSSMTLVDDHSKSRKEIVYEPRRISRSKSRDTQLLIMHPKILQSNSAK